MSGLMENCCIRKIATALKHKLYLKSRDEVNNDTEDEVDGTTIRTKDINSRLDSVHDGTHIEDGTLDTKVTLDVAHNDDIDARNHDSGQITYEDLKQYIRLMYEAPAFNWLTHCLSRELYLCPANQDTMKGIRQSLLDSLLPPQDFSATQAARKFRVRFQIDWDPASFLRLQDYEEQDDIALENAITLTESAAGPQATLCREYLCKVWPSTGALTLASVQSSPHVTKGALPERNYEPRQITS